MPQSFQLNRYHGISLSSFLLGIISISAIPILIRLNIKVPQQIIQYVIPIFSILCFSITLSALHKAHDQAPLIIKIRNSEGNEVGQITTRDLSRIIGTLLEYNTLVNLEGHISENDPMVVHPLISTSASSLNQAIALSYILAITKKQESVLKSRSSDNHSTEPQKELVEKKVKLLEELTQVEKQLTQQEVAFVTENAATVPSSQISTSGLEHYARCPNLNVVAS